MSAILIFLTFFFSAGVTNPQERVIRKGFKNVPEASHEFEDAWKKSKNYQDAIKAQKDFDEEIEKVQPHKEFQEEVRAQKTRLARKGGAYTAAYHTQVFACVVSIFAFLGNELERASAG